MPDLVKAGCRAFFSFVETHGYDSLLFRSNEKNYPDNPKDQVREPGG